MEKRNAKGLTEAEFLAQYHPGDYERPSVTVDMMVLKMQEKLENLQLLLIQRKDHPYMDQWALAGGFVNMDESCYQAACRELEEETGLKNVYLEQLYTMSRPDRDPRMRVIDVAYFALLPYQQMQEKQKELKAGDDAKHAQWFDVTFTKEELTLKNLKEDITITYKLVEKTFINGVTKIVNYVPELVTKDALAFDHAEIILEGLMRIQNKVMYADLAFNLVPEMFTLPDLQKVYEVILGKNLYKKNFREKIQEKVMATEKSGKPITSNRTATLYQYVE